VKLLPTFQWIRSPADRDVITRWTKGSEVGQHVLEVPPPPGPDRYEFLVLGDSGDSEASGSHESPQDAVAHYLAQDAALPGSSGRGCMVLHMGDVVYMTGERRLYDRNFRRPYSAFLTPESTIENLVFRLPFLPVPGNHDYYDFPRWARAIVKVPFLGSSLRALARELFAFSIPVGGSEMGRTYMEAFVDGRPDGAGSPLPYQPGSHTRLPNRYYRFRLGMVDFFALDSNTLDAPPPSSGPAQVRADAARRVKALEAQADALDHELRRDEEALERWQAAARDRLAADPARVETIEQAASPVTDALTHLAGVVPRTVPEGRNCSATAHAVEAARDRWSRAAAELMSAPAPEAVARALQHLEGAAEHSCDTLQSVEGCLVHLPESPAREDLLAARARLEEALEIWREVSTDPPPADLCEELHRASLAALDAQRELTRERGRMRYRADDHDRAQLEWLDQALAASERERPDGWRIVYLHHPLYTTIGNHAEGSDVQGVRGNLLTLLKGRAHLVLAGHSHAMEWIRSSELPDTGLFVTGGGGQVHLRRSILDPRRFQRYRDRFEALRRAGATECAVAGVGPPAADGADGPLYHYLRVEVTPDALYVRPVGVRRMARGYRQEAPMPVYRAPDLADDPPLWQPLRLEAVEIRRGQPPQAHWA
jgi:hypothetical protein